jgi:hypothetical protein
VTYSNLIGAINIHAQKHWLNAFIYYRTLYKMGAKLLLNKSGLIVTKYNSWNVYISQFRPAQNLTNIFVTSPLLASSGAQGEE